VPRNINRDVEGKRKKDWEEGCIAEEKNKGLEELERTKRN